MYITCCQYYYCSTASHTTAPTFTQVDPTCTVATGTITVTSATAGLTFSLDGAAFAAYPAGGTGVASGSPYTHCSKCCRSTSPAANITIAPQPATPTAPTFTQVNPTCTVATGTITVTSATAGLTFSLDGQHTQHIPLVGTLEFWDHDTHCTKCCRLYISCCQYNYCFSTACNDRNWCYHCWSTVVITMDQLRLEA